MQTSYGEYMTDATKLVRAITSYTDHDFYANPVEVTRVELYCATKMTPEQIEVAKRQQEMRLRSHSKRMPHQYWISQSGETK